LKRARTDDRVDVDTCRGHGERELGERARLVEHLTITTLSVGREYARGVEWLWLIRSIDIHRASPSTPQNRARLGRHLSTYPLLSTSLELHTMARLRESDP
jgi:hypothetical protein